MTLATSTSFNLVEVPNCDINVPGSDAITFFSLPEISDNKTASYNQENVIGRSSPIKIYNYSEERQISFRFSLYILKSGDDRRNLRIIRALQSATY